PAAPPCAELPSWPRWRANMEDGSFALPGRRRGPRSASPTKSVEAPMVLEGKAAVVTGAGQGIGAALAQALAAEGALVVANDIEVSRAEATVAAIRAAGGTAVADPSDVSTFGGADAVVDACVRAYGRI